jgi:hypothetical protein
MGRHQAVSAEQAARRAARKRVLRDSNSIGKVHLRGPKREFNSIREGAAHRTSAPVVVLKNNKAKYATGILSPGALVNRGRHWY